MGSRDVIVVGTGKFACNVISYLEEDQNCTWNIIGVVDLMNCYAKNNDATLRAYPLLGDEESLPELFAKGIRYAALGVGATSRFDMTIKETVFTMIKDVGFTVPTLIAQTAVVHRTFRRGEGVVVPDHVVIDPEVEVGDNVVLSPFVYLCHHVRLGSHVFVSSFTTFQGATTVGNCCFVGMSSTVCRDVGRNCNIYPGTLVMDEVKDNSIGFGSPMRQMNKGMFCGKATPSS